MPLYGIVNLLVLGFETEHGLHPKPRSIKDKLILEVSISVVEKLDF